MKFFHIADLHLGKTLNGFSMFNVQDDILNKIVSLAKENDIQSLIIAGDVYDKTIPTIEGIQLLERFLVMLNQIKINVFIITGNHDSIDRVGFASELLKNSNIHIAKQYSGNITPILLNDEYGEIKVWMLPYIKPANVRKFFDFELSTYADAVSAILNSLDINVQDRNIFIGHQCVSGAMRCNIEDILYDEGKLIDPEIFSVFDYVALGDNHRAQYMFKETIRYSGSPLKYSFNEVNYEKSVTMMEIKKKNEVLIKELPLIPLLDLREIRGCYKDIMKLENYKNTNVNDYVRVILTDEEDIPDAISKIRTVYPNIMRLEYENKRTSKIIDTEPVKTTEKREPLQQFDELYQKQIGHSMSDEQENYVKKLFNEIWNVETLS
ncbi:MAG: exonuclease SbcCD subunit D [Christensenellaceae bacterium]|jgi:exonuclease SbcD|nr:exonuclease SbcCD subunit D [Christensenellaceae bacterium]